MLKSLEISHSPSIFAPRRWRRLVSAHEKVEYTVYTTLYLRQRGIREEIRFAHPPTSGVYYHQLSTYQWVYYQSTSTWYLDGLLEHWLEWTWQQLPEGCQTSKRCLGKPPAAPLAALTFGVKIMRSYGFASNKHWWVKSLWPFIQAMTHGSMHWIAGCLRSPSGEALSSFDRQWNGMIYLGVRSQQRLCCVNQHTSCTASTWMADWAATRPCTLRWLLCVATT